MLDLIFNIIIILIMTNKISANLSRALDQNDISGYLRKIRKFPLLSHEEEESLSESMD